MCLLELCKLPPCAPGPFGPRGLKPGRGFIHIDSARLLRRGEDFLTLALISAAFLAGAAAGAFVGSGQPEAAGELLNGEGVYASGSFAGQFMSCAGYPLLVLFLSTSLLGVLLIPAAMAFRGFSLACSAACLAQAYPEEGTALVLTVLGLPALFTVPARLSSAHWAGCFSARLLAGFARRPLPMRGRVQGGRASAVILLLLAAAAAERFIVPPLVRALI